MAAEGEFPKVDGDILYASEVNSLHSSIKQLYTGNAIDTVTSGTTTASIELTAITSSIRNYVVIEVTGYATVQGGLGAAATVDIKTEIKETGGAYGTILDLEYLYNSGAETEYVNATSTVKFYHLLTAGEKANGYQVKVTSTSTGTGGATASFTNKQVVAYET